MYLHQLCIKLSIYSAVGSVGFIKLTHVHPICLHHLVVYIKMHIDS